MSEFVMKKTLVITDVTQMPSKGNSGNEVCVVGIDAEGQCIRPVCDGGFRKKYLMDMNGKVVVRHGAKVEFDLYPIKTQPPHIEDMKFEPSSISGKGICGSAEWEKVLNMSSFNSVEEMYGGFLQDLTWVAPGAKTRSIATLVGAKIIDIKLTPRSAKPRMKFLDQTGSEFNRPVSDLTLWDRCFLLVRKQGHSRDEVEKELNSLLQKADRLYLRLGLARPWEPQDDGGQKCWIQVSGVYTFPDYLNGKCFADF